MTKMAITRSQFYQSGFALLVWLQKIEKCVATKYDVHLPEMNYLASNLSPRECYDFYNLLSHRRAIRGQISVYAEKEKAREIPCINLLATWLSDPTESRFRSHENIELKLREIKRKDLARWILEKINSSLERRRQLNVHEINRQIEESDINGVIVRNRIGERILPITSVEDQSIIKNENIGQDERQASCVLWKIFFSCLIVLALIVLFLCFYRFLYTKLRCICRRFNASEDEERCLPEQTYGTTSCSDFPMTNRQTKNNFFPNYTDQSSSSFAKNTSRTNSMKILKNNFPSQSKFPQECKITEKNATSGRSKIRSRSENFSFVSREKNWKLEKMRKLNNYKKPKWISCSCNLMEKQVERIYSFGDKLSSRNEKAKTPEVIKNNEYLEKVMTNSETSDNVQDFEPNLIKTNCASCKSSTELSETYDELGLLFSRQLKQQTRPCGRKYCSLSRKLQRNKIFNHDVKKCKNRRLGNFMAKIMISGDRRADCSSGNICRDTYDEYELMRASREEREKLTLSMIERRKYFLDQPCLSN